MRTIVQQELKILYQFSYYARLKESLYLPDEILVYDGILMATAEKALLDAVYLRQQTPFADEIEKDSLDWDRLSRPPPFTRSACSEKWNDLSQPFIFSLKIAYLNGNFQE